MTGFLLIMDRWRVNTEMLLPGVHSAAPYGVESLSPILSEVYLRRLLPFMNVALFRPELTTVFILPIVGVADAKALLSPMTPKDAPGD